MKESSSCAYFQPTPDEPASTILNNPKRSQAAPQRKDDYDGWINLKVSQRIAANRMDSAFHKAEAVIGHDLHFIVQWCTRVFMFFLFPPPLLPPPPPSPPPQRLLARSGLASGTAILRAMFHRQNQFGCRTDCIPLPWCRSRDSLRFLGILWGSLALRADDFLHALWGDLYVASAICCTLQSSLFEIRQCLLLLLLLLFLLW